MFKFNHNSNLTKFMTISASALMLLGIGAPAVSADTTNAHAESINEALNQGAKQGEKHLAQETKDGNYNLKHYDHVNVPSAKPSTKRPAKKAVHVRKSHKHVAKKTATKRVAHLRKARKHVAKKIATKKTNKKHIINRKVNSHKIAKHFARKHLTKKAKKSTKAERIQKQINALNRELKEISREIAELN